MAKNASVWLLAGLVACSSQPQTKRSDSESLTKSAGEDLAPTLRLPKTLAAKSYRAQLTLDPTQPTFTGRIELRGALSKSVKTVWLNAREITVTRATVTDSIGAATAEAAAHGGHFLSLTAERALAAGDVTIEIEYSGKIQDNDTTGIFRQKDGDDWYIYTQFEDIDARRAFPCIDEPGSKVPWQLTIDVPKQTIAVSNTSPTSNSSKGPLRRFEFAETKPLPSYLIAFAVGPFEFVDAGKSRDGVQLRIVTPKGRTGEARYAAEVTAPILAILEDYLGVRYPYRKLDSIAIPLTVGFSAMEHPGLITYTSRLILTKPDRESLAFKRSYAYTAAHELGHQWFGNLVTHAWWDDIWLNESFATWTETVALAKLKPTWGSDVDEVNEKIGAMWADSISSARKVHQPVTDRDGIANAFDGITYAKGASLLRMFEAWMGRESFQKSLHEYIAAHKWGTATSADFLRALDSQRQGAGAAFSSFIEQVGVPELAVELSCDSGKKPSLSIRQKRFTQLGQQARAQTWRVPVCVRYDQGKASERSCFLLSEKTASFSLEQAATCPRWLLPNAGGIGYYRSSLNEKNLGALRKALPQLTAPERLGLVDDVIAMTSTGGADIRSVLALVPMLAADDNRRVIGRAARFVSDLAPHVAAQDRAAFASFIRRAFSARAKRLGLTGRKGDSDDDVLVRASVVPLVATWGGDQRLIKRARTLVRAELDKPGTIAADDAATLLLIAAFHGDAALFDDIVAAAKAEKDRRRRTTLLLSLPYFQDPRLLDRAASLTLDTDLDIRETMWLFPRWSNQTRAAKVLLDFIQQNFDVLMKRLPEQVRWRVTGVLGRYCDDEGRDQYREFFTPRFEALPGGKRGLAQAIERQDLCIAQSKVHAPQLSKFLRARR